MVTKSGRYRKKCDRQGVPVDRVSMPTEFYRLNKFVMIAADVLFVSGGPFCHYLKKIKFLTVECLPRRTAKQLANALRKVVFLYARGGFVVRHAMITVGPDIPELTISSSRTR